MLQKLIIQNYKGFQSKTIIEFSLPCGKYGSGLNIIVGSNNSGKSTIFDAIGKFGRFNSIINDEEVQKSTRNNFLLELTDCDGIKHTLKAIDGGGIIDNTDSNWFFEDRAYKIGTNKLWSDTGSVGKTNIFDYQIHKYTLDSQFVMVLQSLEGKLEKTKFVNLIKRVVPNFSGYSVNFSNNQAYVEYTTGNNIGHKAGTLGEGVIGIFKLLLPLINLQNRVLVIDEPELSLHPQAQKELVKIYSEYSANSQIIIITHSPNFIDWKSIKNGGQVIRVSKPYDTDCKANWFTAKSKKEIVRIAGNKNRPFVLDNIGKELFFAENIVLCEGQTDPVRYHDFVSSEFDNINFEFLGYGCGSDADMLKFIPILKEINLNVACIFDKPIKKDGNLNTEVQANINKAKSELPNGVFVSPTNEVQYLFQENNYGVKEEYKNELIKIFGSIINYFVNTK